MKPGNEPLKCPRCGQALTPVGKFWICPEHGQVSLDKPSEPLRIFLSYGHDANEELVRRIKADLEQRGHDVWFDKSEIKFGDNWRRAITDGILKSNRVLSFLSKHSTRDPGVCRYLQFFDLTTGPFEERVEELICNLKNREME